MPLPGLQLLCLTILRKNHPSAWGGSLVMSSPRVISADYPRECGGQCYSVNSVTLFSGSSPRMRGAVY